MYTLKNDGASTDLIVSTGSSRSDDTGPYIQRIQIWRRNLNRPTENETFAEGHRRMKRRCVRLGKQRASTVAKSVILESYADQRSQLCDLQTH